MRKNNSFDKVIQQLKTINQKIHTHSIFLNIKKLKLLKYQFFQQKNDRIHEIKKPISFNDEIKEFVKSMFSAMIFALIIRTFILQPFNIPSESMLPNLLVGDYIFVSKYSYGYSRYSLPFAPNLFNGRIWESEPKRGDVAVFRVTDDGDKDYIKRIVGIPGDRIRFEKGTVIVNDKPAFIGKVGTFGNDTIDSETIGADILAEQLNNKNYHILDVFDAPYDNTNTYIVPPDHYFFAGDNRDNSQDSRFINGPVGFMHKDKLLGKAQFIFFSIRDAQFLEFWKWSSAIRFDRIFKAIN
jgi:signal peptidase I